jgi:hypothetical protein
VGMLRRVSAAFSGENATEYSNWKGAATRGLYRVPPIDSSPVLQSRL